MMVSVSLGLKLRACQKSDCKLRIHTHYAAALGRDRRRRLSENGHLAGRWAFPMCTLPRLYRRAHQNLQVYEDVQR